jgi:hypothetical protein
MYRTVYDYYNRSFAFCQSCFWTATVFAKIDSYECPFCPGKNVELIPLNQDEKYEYRLEPNKGLEIEFSREVRNLETEE